MGPSPRIAGNEGDASSQQSRLYKLIVTPIVFISFIFSLAWVEFRYSSLRPRSDQPSRLPTWLHRILYRSQQPYQYVHALDKGEHARPAQEAESGWYYRTKQKKLLKMEVVDAFQIRNTVLLVLGLLLALAAWLSWRIASWAISYLTT